MLTCWRLKSSVCVVVSTLQLDAVRLARTTRSKRIEEVEEVSNVDNRVSIEVGIHHCARKHTGARERLALAERIHKVEEIEHV